MTPHQKAFCQDVATALHTWTQYHPKHTLNEKQQETHKNIVELYRTSSKSIENELNYYRSMNKLLKEISGVAIKEMPGTGDPFADFDRAMKIVE